jgi:hypothetical protein
VQHGTDIKNNRFPRLSHFPAWVRHAGMVQGA